MAAWPWLGERRARVTIGAHDRDGVGYLVKSLGRASDADMPYELGKFGSRFCELTLSNSVRESLRRANRRLHRTVWAQSVSGYSRILLQPR